MIRVCFCVYVSVMVSALVVNMVCSLLVMGVRGCV